MKDRILVIGGYGHVGQSICRALAATFPGKVDAAGRSLEQAKAFCETTAGQVRPVQLDVAQPIAASLLDQTRLVILCLDQQQTHLVEQCFQTGTHYLDISANSDFLTAVSQRHEQALAGKATGIISVGLAPGITNLMARDAVEALDEVDKLNITLMLGLGDAHGKAAIDWTLAQMNSHFTLQEAGQSREVAGFSEPESVRFGGRLGQRTAYRFNFSDQHQLARTLALPRVSTRFCLDSRLMTGLLALARKTGLLALLRYRAVHQAVAWIFGRIRIGQPRFAVKVDAWGKRDGQSIWIERSLEGREEAVITAALATWTATRLYQQADILPHGVHSIEQLFTLEQIEPLLAEQGVRVSRQHS